MYAAALSDGDITLLLDALRILQPDDALERDRRDLLITYLELLPGLPRI